MRNIILFIFLFFYVNLFSQESDAEIQIINFNSSVSYVSGSSVSVHLDPSGIFDFVNAADLDDDLNNSFILELSGPGGDFDNPTVLNIANDFYTSLINGVLPDNLAAGEYKLRIRSTQPELVEETEFFTVINSSIDSTLSLSSNIESNSSYTQCLNDNVNLINPFFGSYNQNYNSLSGDMPSSNKFFTVTPTSDQSSIEVNIIDVSDGSSVTLNPISGTVYQIPENLSVGTYNIQVHETTTEGFSTFFSSAFIFHTSATIFGNASSETVCVGAEVTFNIDVGDLGIGSNSMGSYYIISFGDGSEDLILTQAQLLELYSDPINPITHIFEEASCTANGNSSFLVSFKLFNKGVDTQCDNYSQNGLGASKDIATAEAPDAQFELAAEQCINEDILVNNTTIPGSYPTNTGECAGDVNYDWQVKKPSFSDFLPVSLLNNSWVSGENLIIPTTDVDEIGCWEIKLIAVNPAACLSESQYVGIINIEDIPEANFSPVGDVCENDVINLMGESNIIPVICDIELLNETPTYLWSISPDSGYVLFNDSENNPTTLQSQNPIISFTEAGSYTLALSVTTECGTDTLSETINVLGNPNVDIELDSMTFCSTSSLLIDFSDQFIPIYSDGFSAPSDYTWTVNGLDIDSDDYAFVNNTSSADEFPTIQLNSFGTYNITVTAGSNCDTPASDTIIITLSQEPTITNTITSQDICSLEPSVQFDLTSDVDGTTYSWIAAENENLSGYEESGTTAFIPSQTITNSTNSDQYLVYTIIPIANGCAGTPFEYTLTVQPIPVVADKDETICDGETFTIQPMDNFPTEIIPIGTTYSWPDPLSNPTGVVFGGTSASAQSLISQTLSNTSDYPATLTYSITPNYDGCDGDDFDIVITVNPTVSVDAIPDQVLCNGDNTLAVEFNTTIADNTVQDSGEISYTWTNDNNDIGLAASGTGNIPSFTTTNSTTAPITANITVTSLYTYNDVSCEGESEIFSITVNPSPQVNFSEDEQFITSGDTTVPVSLSSPTNGVTFSWTAVAEDGITGLTTTSGTDTILAETLLNTTTEPQTVTYTAIATGDVGFDCEGLPTDYIITVNPLAQVNLVDDQVICNEENLSIEFITNITGGTITYFWNNDNIEIGLTAEGNGNLDFLATNNSEQPITANINVTPTFSNGGNSNQGDSINFSITVNPTAQVDSVDDIVVSNGELIGPVEFTTINTGGTTTYQWTNDNTDIGIANSGNENISEFAAVNAGDIPVTATIEVIPSFEENGLSCSGEPINFNITINPDAQVNEIDDLVYNDGDLVQIPFSSSNSGGENTYEWTSTEISTGLESSGSGNIEFIATNTVNSPIVTTVTVTPNFENGGVSNSGNPETFTITVNPVPQVELIQNSIICAGEEVGEINFSTLNTGGTTTYAWTNDNPAIGLAASGIGDIPSFTAINNTSSTIVVTIEVTPTFENGGTSSTGNSETFTITVNPGAQVDSVVDQVLCNGELTNDILFTTTNIDGTTTYAWTNDNPAIGLAASGTGDIPSFTAINNTTSTIVATIEVTPTYENGGVTCAGNPETFTITVNPDAQVDSVVDQVLCVGELTNDILFTTTNIDGTTTYAWTNDNPAIGLAASGTGDIPSFVVAGSSSGSEIATIQVTPTYENGGVTCAGNSETFTITVNPGAQVDSVVDQVLCNGELTNDILFTTTNIDGTTTYAWTNDNPAIGLAASGTGDIPSFTAINNTTSTIVATIEVTPTYENGGVTCAGNPETFTITVNPDAQVDSVVDQVLCVGELTNDILFTTTNIDGTTTYAWTNDNPAIGLAASGTGDIPSFVVAGSSSGSEIATIQVTPTYENGGVTCAGNSETFTITVNPGAQVDSVVDQVLCNGELTNDILFTTTNIDGTTTYAWTNDNPAIGLAASGTGDIPSFTAINNTTSTIVATIEVTPTYENGGVTCAGNPETFTITVNPDAQVDSVVDQVLCVGELTNDILFTTTNIDGTTTYAWTNDNPAIGLAASGTGDIPSFVVAGSSSGSEIATIQVTPTYENGGVTCAGNSETFTITVNPGAQVDSVVDQVLCNGELTNDILFTTTNIDGTTTYAWTNDNPAIGLAASGTGDIPSFTAINNTTSTIVATIEVTPTYENGGVTCAGNPETFTISVLSDISITSFNITDAIDCNNPFSGAIDITVSGGSGIYDFLWSNGETSQNLTAVTSGDYFVTITDNEGCAYTSNVFNIFRQQDLVVNLTTQTLAVCETSLVTQQNNISISGGLPPYEISWSAGAISLGDNTEMTAYEDGIYNVLVTDQYGCEVDTEIIVDLEDLSVNGASFDYVSIGTLNCGLGVLEEIEFTNTSDGDVLGVTWDFGDGSPPVSGDVVTHQYTTVGEFEATITVQYNYGCIEVYSQEIEVADGFGIMLPTAFSPNNDGINDTIRPVYNCVNDINMSVYDTFGSLIYYENSIDLQGWDGILNGKKAENGNYLIVVNGTTIFGEKINLKGVFVLLR